jgi:ABC-2 type transport system permease protein
LALAMPVVAAVVIYLHHNAGAIQLLDINPAELIPIDARFFYYFLRVEGLAALLLTVFVAPGLVAPDLAHNALPLYLCRPFSRAEYVLGKLAVLVGLLSAVTWIPGLLLVAFQGHLEGAGWLADHIRLLPAMFLGGWVWILVLSLLGLALSAWVRWRTVAAGLLFGVLFVAAAAAVTINGLFQTRWGGLVDPRNLVQVIWEHLFYGAAPADNVPVWSAWAGLAALCGFCLLLLRAKIRAYEVVR